MKVVKYRYGSGDHVKIKAINIMGRVEGMLTDSDGHQYRVCYWNDGQRYSPWLFDWELE